MKQPNTDVEYLYDTYSPMLYSIALELLDSSDKAAQTLIIVFEKIYLQPFSTSPGVAIRILLVKLLLQTVHELFDIRPSNDFRSAHFHSSPLLQKLFFGQSSLEDYCTSSGLTRLQVARRLREEMQVLQNTRNGIDLTC